MTALTTANHSPADSPTNPAPERISFRNLWRFLGYTKPYWRWFVIGGITAMWRMILPLMMPVLLAYVIDRVIAPYLSGDASREASLNYLWIILGVFGAVAAVHAVATIGRFYCPSVSIAQAIRDVRYQLFCHLQRLSLGFHTQRPTGGIVARVISDVMTAQKVLERLLIVTLQQGFRSVVIVVILLWQDWVWALIALCTLPIFLVVTRLIRTHLRKASREVQESVERMSGHVQERMAMIREVQSFTAEDHEERIVRDEVERLKDHTLRQRLLNGFLVGASEITRFGGLAIVLGFGVFRVMDGHATTGSLALFYLYTRMLLNPLQFFANLYGQMHEAAAASDRVFDFLDTEPDIRDAPDAEAFTVAGPPSVAFSEVRFAYPSDDPTVVLDGVNFDVPGGTRVAIVGESGAGKSTLLSLLPRFYDIQEGRILIDGRDVRSYTTRSLRRAIGIVPQEPVVFSGTLRENIQYGRLDASEEEIVAAAKAANAHGFIEELADGYNSVVGENGCGLSGGQIQRIAIARAFLNDPAILILDEATSNLDAVSESLVFSAIDRLAKGRTTFIIAHRLSTARAADRIIVLDRGRVVEEGTHDELLRKGGAYADLWARQVGDYETYAGNNGHDRLTHAASCE